jgi:hypothetical protein
VSDKKIRAEWDGENITRTWSGMTTKEYKQHKELKKENLRDNMTNTELVLNMLAGVAATDISIERQPAVSKLNAKEHRKRKSVAGGDTIEAIGLEEGGGE